MSNGTLTEQEVLEVQNEVLLERIRELEDSLMQDGWMRLGSDDDDQFSREGLDEIIRRSQLSYRKNPLINHAVNVQSHYVIGQGVTADAEDKGVQAVVQRFWDDPGNRAELTSHTAMMAKEVTLATTGNVFLVLFPNPTTGHVKVRSIPVVEVRDIICNPDDSREPWYYKRVWNQRTFTDRGTTQTEQRTAYYPDWRYEPEPRDRLKSIDGAPILWTSPVCHVKAGGLETDRFGVPEVYPALDWAKAVKEQMEDYATLLRAHSRLAWKMTTAGGRQGVAAARRRMETTLAPDGTQRVDSGPPNVASTFIGAEGYDIQPIKTAGMAPHPEDNRRSWLMVAAATGIPETILTGNADSGNLATAKTLDRPTELKMTTRQSLWDSVLTDILDYVIDLAVIALRGPLAGTVERDDTGRQVVTLAGDIDRRVNVDFPNVLDRDIVERVKAVVSAATLDGDAPIGHLPIRLVARELLLALNVDDVEDILAGFYPEEEEKWQPPLPAQAEQSEDEEFPPRPDVESMMIEAVRELRAALSERAA